VVCVCVCVWALWCVCGMRSFFVTFFLGTAAAIRSSARGVTPAADCKASICGGMANYPVAPGMQFYATFNVPGLPLNRSAIENDIT